MERGFEQFSPALRGPARTLAVIGFCVAVIYFVYHLPFNWLSVGGDSLAKLPSYMLPG